MSDLPHPLDDSEEIEHPPLSRRQRYGRWVTLGVLFLLCAGILTRRFLASGSSATEFFSQQIGNKANGSPAPSPTPLPEPGKTILLMGRGGAGHDGGALADTIVLARILETQKRIILLSLPRDLWVSIPYKGSEGVMGKINSSYAIGIDSRNYANKDAKYTGPTGGGALAKDVVTAVTGLPIDTYVTVDFSGFSLAVDTIGGIDLTVDKAFSDYEYPIAGREDVDCSTYTPIAVPNPDPAIPNSEADLIAAGKLDANLLSDLPKQYPCRYELVHFDAGKQHMNGATALKYVRSRHSSEDGNDFSRSRRQKIVLEAVADRLFSINAVTKIPTFFSTLRSHLDTDLTTTEILGLLPKAEEYRGYAITSLTLSTDNYLGQGYTSEGQFQLFPLTGVNTYAPIKQWIAHAIDAKKPIDYPLVEVNGNWKNSSASATLAATLNHLGYPTKLGRLTMKDTTTSATLYVQSPTVRAEAIKAIQTAALIDEGHTITKLASGSSDIKIVLP